MDRQDLTSYSSYFLSFAMIVAIIVLIVLLTSSQTKISSLSSQNIAEKATAAALAAQNKEIADKAAADKAASDAIIAQKNQAIAAQVEAAASAAKTYQRPAIEDKGFIEMTHGWYDAQGLGGCYDYCRYVQDRNSNWFSCILADKNGSSNASTNYTPKDLYTEAGLQSKKCLE